MDPHGCCKNIGGLEGASKRIYKYGNSAGGATGHSHAVFDGPQDGQLGVLIRAGGLAKPGVVGDVDQQLCSGIDTFSHQIGN